MIPLNCSKLNHAFAVVGPPKKNFAATLITILTIYLA